MKKTLITLMAFAIASLSYAQDIFYPENNPTPEESTDSSTVTSLADIIGAQSNLQSRADNYSHYKKIWGMNTFFNLSYNTTKFDSKELPTSANGKYADEYDNSVGFGMQWGHFYNFHKKPIGTVLFIGLDYTWLDLNANHFSASNKPIAYEFANDNKTFNMPWYNEKWTFDYGMSLGPSLTFYPFTSLGKKGTDNIRIQFYYHVGYSVALASINKVPKGADPTKTSTQMAFGQGFWTSFGMNLSWNLIGVGYEWRSGSSYKFNSIDSDFKTGNVKFKQNTNRLYLQFRF